MDEFPLIVDIKRHSLEDGPGIRSVVFFKGCPLRCIFCHNPEAQEPGPEILFSPQACISCRACAEVCPTKAVTLGRAERIDRKRCCRCGRCVQACPGSGLRQVGISYPVAELAELLLRDRAFYRHSQGGITLSGGECALYPDYVEALLKRLRPVGVHVVLETSGFFPYETFCRQILPFVDMIYYDLKIADAEAHMRYTGQPNRRILENFRRLVRENRVEVLPRIPLVPGVTATPENLTAIATFLREEGIRDAALLPYNPLGMEKFQTLGRPKPPMPEHFMPSEEEKAIGQRFYSLFQGNVSLVPQAIR